MKLLLIDTSSSNSIFGVSYGLGTNNIVAYVNNGKKTSATIMDGISEALASTDISEIDKIFVVCGPGSFTGIRIGVSVALAMGYAKNIEVLGLSVFHGFNSEGVKVIPSRAGFYYYSKDGIEGELDEESLLKEDSVICYGEDSPFKKLSVDQYSANLFSYAWEVVEGKKSSLPAEPYYLKKCQAERMLDLKNGNKGE